jgi:hypothetical protein
MAVIEDTERLGLARCGAPSESSVLFPLSGINGLARLAVRKLPHLE